MIFLSTVIIDEETNTINNSVRNIMMIMGGSLVPCRHAYAC